MGFRVRIWKGSSAPTPAGRSGRPLTERESAARQAYQDALERECHFFGFHSAGGFEPLPDIHQAITEALYSSLDKDQFHLFVSAVRGAEQEGRPPTEQEAAVIEVFHSGLVRLCQLAGFGSTAEFRIYEEPSEEDNQ